MSLHVRSSADYVRELNVFPDLVLLVQAPAMEIIDVNQAAADELGWPVDDVIGRKLSEFGDQSDTSLNPVLIERAFAGETVRFDRKVRDADGAWRNYNFAAKAIGDDSLRFLLVGREMEALAHSHSQLAGLLRLADLTDDIFVVTDQRGDVTYANAAAARVHGGSHFVGRPVTDFIHETDTGFPEIVEQVLAGAERAEGRVLGRRADGTPVPLGIRTIFDSASRKWFTVERDISDLIEAERRAGEMAEDLRRQASTDALTGVANRFALNEALAEAIAVGETFAVMLLDMDDFKSVNDTLGHVAGDEFLQCVAQRIVGAIKDDDFVARLGGDEFVVVLPGIDGGAASKVATRMIESVGQDYSVAGHDLVRSCSIGIAVFEPGDDVSAVLRKADRAAYRAKHEGRSRYVVH